MTILIVFDLQIDFHWYEKIFYDVYLISMIKYCIIRIILN